jgi:MarR family transcriptional regulator for hemolysin
MPALVVARPITRSCRVSGVVVRASSTAGAGGLLTRRRDPANRRVHIVELTEAGEALFHRLRGAAAAFDRRLRAGLTREEIAELEGLLERLRRNVAGR